MTVEDVPEKDLRKILMDFERWLVFRRYNQAWVADHIPDVVEEYLRWIKG